jgi:hypothetical protein
MEGTLWRFGIFRYSGKSFDQLTMIGVGYPKIAAESIVLQKLADGKSETISRCILDGLVATPP